MNVQVGIILNTQTVGEFARTNRYVQFAKKVRVNKNGYPFVTFYKKTEEGMKNLYFAQKQAEQVEESQRMDSGFLNSFVVIEVANADGEVRKKLAGKKHF